MKLPFFGLPPLFRVPSTPLEIAKARQHYYTARAKKKARRRIAAETRRRNR